MDRPTAVVRAGLALAAACVLLALTASAGAAAQPLGWIAGLTQISYGCPGPVREGAPPCERWSRFPHARFAITRLTAGAKPRAGSRRTIASDVHGRFRVAMPAGLYLVTPLPRAHTRGGTAIRLLVRAGATTRGLVRFHGVPQMY